MDLFRDSIWQFVLGFIGLLLVFVIYYAQRSNKSLLFLITNQVDLLLLRQEVKDKIKFIYNGRQINDLIMIDFKLTNTGNVSIMKEDFEHPVTVSFNDGCEIISLDIIKMKPDNIKINISKEDGKFIIYPFLMNKKDTVDIRMLASGFLSHDIDARIAGISNIDIEFPKVGPLKRMFIYMALVAASVLALLILRLDGIIGGVWMGVLLGIILSAGWEVLKAAYEISAALANRD